MTAKPWVAAFLVALLALPAAADDKPVDTFTLPAEALPKNFKWSVSWLAFSPDGKQIGVSIKDLRLSETETILVYSLKDKQLLGEFEFRYPTDKHLGPFSRNEPIGFHPVEADTLVCFERGKLLAWKIDAKKPATTLDDEKAAAISRVQALLPVVGKDKSVRHDLVTLGPWTDKSLTVHHDPTTPARTGEPAVWTLPDGHHVVCLAVNAAQSALAVATHSKEQEVSTFALVDYADGKLTTRHTFMSQADETDIFAVATDKHRTRAAAVAADCHVWVFDTTNGKELASVLIDKKRMRHSPSQVMFLDPTTVLVSTVDSGEKGNLHLIDVKANKLLRSFDGGNCVWTMCLSADGTRLAALGGDGVIRFWDTKALIAPAGK